MTRVYDEFCDFEDIYYFLKDCKDNNRHGTAICGAIRICSEDIECLDDVYVALTGSTETECVRIIHEMLTEWKCKYPLPKIVS